MNVNLISAALGNLRRPYVVLALILALVFLPYVVGWKTLMLGVWDAPSIVGGGAYDPSPAAGPRLGRTPDPGAPAWVTEPWLKLISHQFWTEHNLPFWNPYSGYGTPLAAAMQPQPFYPLTIAASLHVTAWTYNIFMLGRLFVAGALMFLFARQFLDALPSLVSAITFMLTGYFIVFLNMPHVSVEVLAPGMLLVFELLLKKNSWTAVGGAAAMIAIGVLGGMPESTFLIMAFSSLYFLCRLLCSAEYRMFLWPLLGKFVAAVMLGLSLSAFLLLPFVELLSVGHDVHQPSNVGGYRTGLAGDLDGRVAITYLLPLIFGPVNQSILSNFAGWTGLRGYWGIVPALLALLAVVSLIADHRRIEFRALRFLIVFFSVAMVLMVLKRFASPVINWIGYLPISEMVVYPKYLEPLIALCVAMLAGIGFSLLVEHRISRHAIAIAAVAILGAMLAVAWTYWPQILPVRRFAVFFYGSIVAGILCVLVVAATMRLLALTRSPQTSQRLTQGLLGLLCLELTVNYIVPAFYIYNPTAPASRNPYKEAPFVEFLRAQTTDQSRVFGRQSLLYPNWAAAFELSDIRLLDALYYRRYMTFVRNFLVAENDTRSNGDLADRFTGAEFAYDFETELEKRFLTLSSVKYLLSSSEYNRSSRTLDGILAQHRDRIIPGFGPDIFHLPNVTRPSRALFQHPPSHRLPFKTTIDPNRPIFEAIAAIKPEAADNSDGVGFRIEIRHGDAIEELFSTFLNPKDVPGDRAGRPIRIDLSKYSGQEIELLFSTDPGPSGNPGWDWAGWVRPAFVARHDDSEAFKNIYNNEVLIYQVLSTLPRASLFRAVDILSDDQVLRKLRDPTFNPLERVILSRESLSNVDAATMRVLEQASPAPFAAAHILAYQSQRVRIETDADLASVLMLTDSNYPGWQAYVNGERVPVLTANYLFRALIVPAGRSSVEFVYQPTSVRLGGLISLLSLLAVASLLFWERTSRQRLIGHVSNAR